MSDNNGYIKLHRKIVEWEWYDDQNTFRLFIHLLLKANHMDNNWRGIAIKRGQHFTSIDGLSKAIGITNKAVRIALGKLQKTNELTFFGANNGTMITICNYDSYQDTEEEEGQTKGEQRANEGQTRGKRRATNKNDKNDKNEKNDKNIVSEIEISETPIVISETTKPIKLKIEDVIFQYHTLCPKFPKVEKVTESRKKKFAVRINDLKTIADWINLFSKAGTQPFLSGDNSTGWKCSFDWIIENDTNYVKILEGKYTKKADPTKFYSDEIKPTW